MGLVVPLWIWLPVVLWVLWRWERRQRIKEAVKWEEFGAHIKMMEAEPVLALAGPRGEAPQWGAWFEMRSLIFTAIVGVIAAFMWAQEPAGGPPEQVAQAPSPAAAPSEPVRVMPPEMRFPPQAVQPPPPPGSTVIQNPAGPGMIPNVPLAPVPPAAMGTMTPVPRNPDFSNAPNIRFAPNYPAPMPTK